MRPVGDIDDLLQLSDQIGMIVFIGDAHGGGQVIGSDEDGVNSGNAADGGQILDASQ